ncbi:MAG: hypothetical protein JXR10_03865 [Cyclobacteriaceae bacterium]
MSCSEDDDHDHEDDDHDHDHEEEVINEVTLTFTPTGGGDALAFKWYDADGDGLGNPTIDAISLAANTEYNLAITLANTLGSEPEDVTEEIKEEGDEHIFFFEFTNNVFSSPVGNGNFDSRADELNYTDQDKDSNPIGLTTNWMTGDTTSGAAFRLILKHQPDLKTATSDATVGGTDLDISFSLEVQ